MVAISNADVGQLRKMQADNSVRGVILGFGMFR
jgi:hypothetical protein